MTRKIVIVTESKIISNSNLSTAVIDVVILRVIVFVLVLVVVSEIVMTCNLNRDSSTVVAVSSSSSL